MVMPRRLYGVIGDPVVQSLSPLLHNTGFRARNIPAALFAWRIAPEKLPDFVTAVRTLPVEGACVTIPHKQKIMPLLDRLTPLADRVGAVNTLYWEDGDLVGHNTDVEGFLRPLLSHPAFPTALILGAGGAARAVLAGLLELPGVERILVAARRPEQARELARSVRPAMRDGRGITEPHPAPSAPPAVAVLPWEERERSDADLIVNTTPMGMAGGDAPAASPLTVFPKAGPDRLAYDLIYQDTPFLVAARSAGWNSLNGRDMFAAQGNAQFLLWTGFPLPEASFAALDSAITAAR